MPFKHHNIHSASHCFNHINGRIQVLRGVLIEEIRPCNQCIKVLSLKMTLRHAKVF